MSSLSQKSILLPFFFSVILSNQVYTMGSQDNPIYIVKTQPKTEENSSLKGLWGVAIFIAPYAIPVILSYALQKYTEDPEVTTANKEIKKIELQTKSHPDYPVISLQNKKNKTEEKKLFLREKQLEIGIKDAQLIEHHKEQLDRFIKCDKPLTPDYCNFMATIHRQKLEQFIQKNDSQA